VAELLKRELNVEAALVRGRKGEFSVMVNDQVVARKGWFRFPPPEKILAAVKQALTA
jgi:hypothetical protein